MGCWFQEGPHHSAIASPSWDGSTEYLVATRVDQCDAIENSYSTRDERARTRRPAPPRPPPRCASPSPGRRPVGGRRQPVPVSACLSAPACQRLPVLASFHWRCWPDCPGNTEHLCSHARRPAAAQRALRVKGDLEGGQVRATPEEGVRPAVVREADHALLSRGDQGHGVGGQSMFAAWTMIQGGAGGSMAVCVAVAACRAVVREADHALQMIRAIMLEDSLYLLHGL